MEFESKLADCFEQEFQYLNSMDKRLSQGYQNRSLNSFPSCNVLA